MKEFEDLVILESILKREDKSFQDSNVLPVSDSYSKRVSKEAGLDQPVHAGCEFHNENRQARIATSLRIEETLNEIQEKLFALSG
ncbi:hypothetical protein [Marispirochaeta aestuarii]|uniref:hypothetical protein n=1 Tax=Marispirochaeta aestuarii TaxID=1963862 RepID=UPI0029C96A10|nr:hypothetical protein [Marispirochaeta aestuarii]